MEENTKNAEELDLSKINLEGLLEIYLNASVLQEELNAKLSVIRDEMIIRLDAENTKGTVVKDYSITKVSRINFKPSLEQAKELGAVKTVESVDTQALKRLHDSGVVIPNTTITNFVMVKPIQKEE